MSTSAGGLRERVAAAVQRIGPRPLPSGRLAIVTMVRDALDVLPSFLSHHATLVDRIHVVDHRSVDGTREYLEEVAKDPAVRGRLEVLRHDGEAHDQAVILTELVRRAFRAGADWVLAVDDDEFVAAGSRQELVGHLGTASSPVVQFEWVNLVPDVLGRRRLEPGEFDPEGDFLWLSEGFPARYGKLALHRELFRAFPHLTLHPGNHKVHPYPGGPKLSGEPVGRLFHVPARSVTQVISKRSKFLSTHDFADVFNAAWLHEYSEQRRRAEMLAGGEPDDEQVLRLLEQVVLPYEPAALTELDRSLWKLTVVRLPPSTRPEPPFSHPRHEHHALHPTPSAGGAALDGRHQARGSRAAGTRRPVFAAVRTDGRVVVRPDRLRSFRQRWARLRSEIVLLGPSRYLTSRSPVRHLVPLIRSSR